MLSCRHICHRIRHASRKEWDGLSGKLQKKYGLFTAICMVVGIVIGSGIFFKTERVLEATGGNALIGVASLAIVGLIMLICSYAFAVMAQKYSKVNGVVDYAETALGERYAYYVGWFVTTLYAPALTGVLAWLSARYTCVILGFPDPVAGPQCMLIAGLYLTANYLVHVLSPVLAGKLQVSGTVIKLIPLCAMAVIGVVRGLADGQLAENFHAAAAAETGLSGSAALMTGVVALAFAYEGWIIATTINAELKNAKRDLPLALTLGSVIVVAVYVCYYLGICGSISIEELLATSSQQAFFNTFGQVIGSLLNVFIVISCLCTMNGLMLGSVRGMYAIATRGWGPSPRVFSYVDPTTNMPTNSAAVGLFLCYFWLFYYYGSMLTEGWFGPFCFDPSELPIVTLYALYIPIFLQIYKEKDLPAAKRLLLPTASILCCLFMIVAAFIAHGTTVFWYLVIFGVFMLAAVPFEKKRVNPSARADRNDAV
jgi:APA family basic amino acid/polyamine antiporter